MIKNLPVMQESWIQPLGWEDPLGEGKAPHCSILAWRIPWTGSLVGYSPWGHTESDRTEQLSTSILHIPAPSRAPLTPSHPFCVITEHRAELLLHSSFPLAVQIHMGVYTLQCRSLSLPHPLLPALYQHHLDVGCP